MQTLPPDQLYRWFGSQPDLLWNTTFEGSTHEIEDRQNFRNVASFFYYLISDTKHGASTDIKDNCPILYQLIQGRVQKRDYDEMTKKGFDHT